MISKMKLESNIVYIAMIKIGLGLVRLVQDQDQLFDLFYVYELSIYYIIKYWT